MLGRRTSDNLIFLISVFFLFLYYSYLDCYFLLINNNLNELFRKIGSVLKWRSPLHFLILLDDYSRALKVSHLFLTEYRFGQTAHKFVLHLVAFKFSFQYALLLEIKRI